MANNKWSLITCEKLDRAANWVGSNVASAFFASLERCSCINLSTTDLDDNDIDEAHDRPLIFANSNSTSLHHPNPNPNPNPNVAAATSD